MRKKKKQELNTKTNRRIGLIAGGTLLVLIVAVLYFSNGNPTKEIPDNIITLEDVRRDEGIKATIRSQYQPTRDYGYGNWKGSKYEINSIFNNLPKIPENFHEYKYLIMTGRITPQALCSLTPEYYEQPEFYANVFKDYAVEIYRNPDPYHWTPEGYGTFPHEMETYAKPGSNFQVCSFTHSSFGVETYQGLGLKVIYPESFTYKDELIKTNPEETQRYIKVNISPKSILVSPTYLQFEKGWSKKITLDISISPDTPSGTYAIGYDVTRAPVEKSAEWYKQYGSLYFGKSYFSLDKNQFNMVIVVE
jgi:hypothetical protein